MKPEEQSINLLSVTRSRAKMYEYSVPADSFISINKDPKELLFLTIGILGDFSNANNEESKEDLRENMLFAAQYFDAYIQSRLNQKLDNYLLLLGSAAYYLADLPGSSLVLIGYLNYAESEHERDDLEYLLIAVLQKNFQNLPELHGVYSQAIIEINVLCDQFLRDGLVNDEIDAKIGNLRRAVYLYGNDRQVLLIDTIYSVVGKLLANSTWTRLPEFTGLTLETWDSVLRKSAFVKELWPAQILLGEKGVYSGNSAIVQMPTSAGKTKSIEIIIRSSFLSSRAKVAVIVAPFKALCNEIKGTLQEAFINENVKIDVPSDAFQIDFEIFSDEDLVSDRMILILTPEKFIYMIRHAPEIVDEVGLLIYDEGHQFDNGIRGVTYELLLSSLRLLVSSNTQIILISAVIINANTVGDWLIGENKSIVDGANLLPTYRTVGFVSWRDLLGRIEFVHPDNPDKEEFFVPRVLQVSSLGKLGKERSERKFPDKNDGKSIAVYLGLKVVKNGAVAIFCGAKTTVKGLCNTINDLFNRQYSTQWPSIYSDSLELMRLKYLHSLHFGEDHTLTKNCEIGVFAHSGNTPQGIRLAVEFAMQKGKIKFLICTSTLAQGVNLPIKYMMVPSFYQAQEKIKTRDFHNLIGRAGRSGIHTEGSIIFTDSQVFDKKAFDSDRYTWNLAKGLLDPRQSEPCTSTILTIFDRIESENGKSFLVIDPIELVNAYVVGSEAVESMLNAIYNNLGDRGFTIPSLRRQFNYKLRIISAIESYLMAHWDSSGLGINVEGVIELAEATLGYFTGTDEQKQKIKQLFEKLAKNVETKVSSDIQKRAYGKTLFGVQDIKDIETWVLINTELLLSANTEEEILEILWPLLSLKIDHSNLAKLASNSSHFEFARYWITGYSYLQLMTSLQATGAYMIWGNGRRQINQEFVLDIADGAFAYDSTLILAAVVEVLKIHIDDIDDQFLKQIDLLQKRLKYGLSDQLAISFYEIGFSDRMLASELSLNFLTYPTYKPELIRVIRQNKTQFNLIIKDYPSYFQSVLDNI